MKILIARLNHETNTFSPIPTPLEAFAPQWDEAAYRDQKGARTAMGAFLAGVLLAFVAFYGGLADLVGRWYKQEEYSHGFFLPLISLYLLWHRRAVLAQQVERANHTELAHGVAIARQLQHCRLSCSIGQR